MRRMAAMIGSTGMKFRVRWPHFVVPSFRDLVRPGLPTAIVRGRTSMNPLEFAKENTCFSAAPQGMSERQIPQDSAKLRRRFLKGTISTFWSVLMLISDAQVHLWEADRPDRPWPKGHQRPPHRPDGFSDKEMLPEMDAVGVNRAVIVPPTWVGENNLMACEAAAKYRARFAVVGRFDVKAHDARAQLEGWLNQPQMLGVRMSFHVKPFIGWLEDGSLDWFWASCERLGIPVMALVPGIVHKLLPIAERHRGLNILIPHMGCPLDVRGADAFAGLS